MIKTGIIGLGKVGRTLANCFASANQLSWTCSASLQSSEFANNITNFSNISQIATLPDVIFLARPDYLIASTVQELSQRFSDELHGTIIVHLSGSLPLQILEPLHNQGAITAAAHPYQTFFSEDISLLNETPWLIESEDDTTPLADLITQTGGKAFTVKPRHINRNLYHASAIMASNYLNTLVYFSKLSADKSGIDSREFLPTILKTTLKNLINSLHDGTPLPLTGPISRSDFALIRKHLQSLRNDAGIFDFYAAMARLTGIAALSEGLIDEPESEELNNLLANK